MMVKKAKQPEEIMKFASMWNMDGLVVIGFCEQDYMYLRNHMRIPFVVYDGFCENPERIVNITIDNYNGGLQMGNHFRGLGHTRALCLADNDIGVDRERYEGFCKGFGAEGVEFLMIPMRREERLEFYHRSLDIFRRVSAVFAVSDYYAIELIQFLQEQGIRVPDEISVAGFDDIPMCEMISPALTTVKQDGALRAKLAIQKLQELREKEEVQAEMMLPVKLVERQSSGKVRV